MNKNLILFMILSIAIHGISVDYIYTKPLDEKEEISIDFVVKENNQLNKKNELLPKSQDMIKSQSKQAPDKKPTALKPQIVKFNSFADTNKIGLESLDGSSELDMEISTNCLKKYTGVGINFKENPNRPEFREVVIIDGQLFKVVESLSPYGSAKKSGIKDGDLISIGVDFLYNSPAGTTKEINIVSNGVSKKITLTSSEICYN